MRAIVLRTPAHERRLVDRGETQVSARPIVVLTRKGHGYVARIDPPLSSGAHEVFASTKDAGWQAARALWERFGLGLRDESDPTHGRFLGRD